MILTYDFDGYNTRGPAGVDGVDGVDGETGDSGVFFSNKGAWVYGTDYISDDQEIDLVEYNDSVYYCKKSNNRSIPPDVDDEYWGIFRGAGKITIFRHTVLVNEWAAHEDENLGNVYKVVISLQQNQVEEGSFLTLDIDAIKQKIYGIFLQEHTTNAVTIYAESLPNEAISVGIVYRNIVVYNIEQDTTYSQVLLELTGGSSQIRLEGNLYIDFGDGTIGTPGVYHQYAYDNETYRNDGVKRYYCIRFWGSNFAIGGITSRYGEPPTLQPVYANIRSSLSDGAFANTDLRNVKLKEDIYSLPAGAFANTKLKKVDLSNIIRIGDGCFNGCTELQHLTEDESNTFGRADAIIGNTAFKDTDVETLDLEFNSIGYEAFNGCTNLREISLHGNEVGDYAFANCTKLREIHFPSNTVNVNGRVNIFGNGVFANCTRIMVLEIPNCQQLGAYFASYCTGLITFTVGDELTNIGAYAFRGCTSLKTVNLPSLEYMGREAFRDCTSLETINFGGSMNEWYEATATAYDWDYNTGDYRIICNDGVITKSHPVVP